MHFQRSIVRRLQTPKRPHSLYRDYIEKWVGLRLIRIHHSLDAAPKARNRRYELTDPFLLFWNHFYLPNSSALAMGHAQAVFEHAIAPHLDEYMEDLFELIAHAYMSTHSAECFGVPAREVGKSLEQRLRYRRRRNPSRWIGRL